ncbi:hypothetical protein [Parafilimonas sp.]|uniref:hypothetical protein n=1 Tax=Parafilimonas sp. TaxID=1969739 RepID=UPI0039E4B384
MAPYKGNGKFRADSWRNTVVHTEDIPLNPNDPNSKIVKVLPNEDYNYLINAIPNGGKMMDKAFNDNAANLQSLLYTDPTSPYYGRSGNSCFISNQSYKIK